MAYATDIIGTSFDRTKELFFPIRPKYWLRMGFISLFAGQGSGGNFNGSNYSRPGSGGPGGSFSDAVTKFNTEALAFLSQYGFVVGIAFVIFYAISLFFVYINSVFTFMFLDGVVKKDIKIGKSFSDNNSSGTNLFFLRFILGIVFLLIMLLILSPLLIAFISNQLANFNLWLLIPMFLTFFVVAILFGLFWFFVYDFVVPIMYFKKQPFSPAWKHFKKIALKNKLEIFLYWLLKIVLGIGAGIMSLVVLLLIILVSLLFVGLGVLMFLGLKALAGVMFATIIMVILGVLFFLLWIYAISVVLVPIPAFFRIYSLEMLKKLKAI